MQDETEIKKNTLVGVLKVVKEEFRVSFDVRLSEIKPVKSSIIHFTADGFHDKDGDRLPAVFTIPGKDMFQICSSNKDTLKQCVNTHWGYHVNRWINVKISQSFFGNRYLLKIIFNGEEIHNIENKDPNQYKQVKVYASNPDIQAAVGSIREFLVNGKVFVYVNIVGTFKELRSLRDNRDL